VKRSAFLIQSSLSPRSGHCDLAWSLPALRPGMKLPALRPPMIFGALRLMFQTSLTSPGGSPGITSWNDLLSVQRSTFLNQVALSPRSGHCVLAWSLPDLRPGMKLRALRPPMIFGALRRLFSGWCRIVTRQNFTSRTMSVFSAWRWSNYLWA